MKDNPTDYAKEFVNELISDFDQDFYVDTENYFESQRIFLGALMGVYHSVPGNMELFGHAVNVMRMIAVREGLRATKVRDTVRKAYKYIAAENDSDDN